MFSMNRDFGVVNDALNLLGREAEGACADDVRRKELEETRNSAIEALARLARTGTKVLIAGVAIPCEAYWDGNGYYYTPRGTKDRSQRFDTLQQAWQHATDTGHEIIGVNMTRGMIPART